MSYLKFDEKITEIQDETSQIWLIRHLKNLIPELQEQITDFILNQVNFIKFNIFLILQDITNFRNFMTSSQPRRALFFIIKRINVPKFTENSVDISDSDSNHKNNLSPQSTVLLSEKKTKEIRKMKKLTKEKNHENIEKNNTKNDQKHNNIQINLKNTLTKKKEINNGKNFT